MRKIIVYLVSAKIEVSVWKKRELYDKKRKGSFFTSSFFF